MKLTAEQKTRLTGYLSREMAGETLSAPEAAEKNFLMTLAGDDLPGIQAEAEAAGKDGPEGSGAPVGAEGTPVPAEPEGMTIGARIGALLAGNKNLAANLAAIKAELATAKADLAAALAEKEALANVAAERDTALARVSALEAEAKTVDDAVTSALAGLNIPRADLPKPAPGAEGGQDSLAALSDKIDAEKDPVRKSQLAFQAWDLMKLRAAAVSGVN